MYLRSGEGEVTVRILHILHFDPERKRMSVIVQHPATSQIILYCKGADSAIIPQLRFTQVSKYCSVSVYSNGIRDVSLFITSIL
jgi:magnesium-transporting ATPase (P-type)